MRYKYSSKLAPSILAFIKHKQDLGYKYQSAERILFEIDRYCAEKGFGPELSKEIVEGWILDKEAANPAPYRNWISTVRQFGLFLQNTGYDAYVVSERFSAKKHQPMPYLLSEAEIQKFFTACGNTFCNNQYKWRLFVLPAFFILMHCCGLRTIEARTLLASNVHIEEGFIDIVGAKHHRDRRIFISDDVIAFLMRYDRAIATIFPGRKHFFPTSINTCCAPATITRNFNQIWDAAGLRKASGKQPRPYSFRHHFAVANINRWTAEGKNVNAMLPYLMRYMGHSSLESTFYYVHLVPDFSADYIRITNVLDDIIPEVSHGN